MVIDDIRLLFSMAHGRGNHVGGTIELLGSSFLADQPSIFGEVNQDYVDRETEWYQTQSLSVDDIPGGPPKIWREVADEDGHINSNYGYLLFHEDNGNQYRNVVRNLTDAPNGRQAVAIYTRPSMHTDWNANGRRDFVCTNAVNYFVREGAVHAVVQMRSNDAVFGYRNDWAWQKQVLGRLAEQTFLNVGTITWQAASLHVYERHYWLVEHWAETGEWDVPLSDKPRENEG